MGRGSLLITPVLPQECTGNPPSPPAWGASVPWGKKMTLQCRSEVRSDTFHLFKEGLLAPPKHLRLQDTAPPIRGNFTLSAMTSAHGGTYRCYSSQSTAPHLLSLPSDPLELLVSDEEPPAHTQRGVRPTAQSCPRAALGCMGRRETWGRQPQLNPPHEEMDKTWGASPSTPRTPSPGSRQCYVCREGTEEWSTLGFEGRHGAKSTTKTQTHPTSSSCPCSREQLGPADPTHMRELQVC